MSEIQGREVLQGTPYRTQVYQATHDGAGNRLPLMERSFISFTYGGKSIEDFNFISIIEGDRLKRKIYGNFSDDTSLYNTVDGQFYWGTNFETNELNLVLATDGFTEKELNEFKRWFQPGVERELILAENPNRGIKARIAETPEYSMIPFESKITTTIANRQYSTGTTLYKGSITLSFVMDDPFWYSIKNVIPLSTVNANGQTVPSLDDKDSLKVIVEDGVPYMRMLEQEIILGDGIYSGTSSRRTVNITPENGAYLFYAGTAPAQTIINFKLTPRMQSEVGFYEYISMEIIAIVDSESSTIDNAIIGKDYSDIATAEDLYLQEPRNYIYKEDIDSSSSEYNYLAVGSKVFKFTTPGIYTGYNQALQIFGKFNPGDSIVELHNSIRDGVKEYYSRAWAMAAVNYLSYTNFVDENMNLQDYNNVNLHYALNKLMWFFLMDVNGNPYPATLSFNSKTGEATGQFQVRRMPNSVTFSKAAIDQSAEGTGDYFRLFGSLGNVIRVTENIGDMVYEKYLTLEDRNHFSETGTVTTNECSSVTTDYINGINDLSINYKHTYL